MSTVNRIASVVNAMMLKDKVVYGTHEVIILLLLYYSDSDQRRAIQGKTEQLRDISLSIEVEVFTPFWHDWRPWFLSVIGERECGTRCGWSEVVCLSSQWDNIQTDGFPCLWVLRGILPLKMISRFTYCGLFLGDRQSQIRPAFGKVVRCWLSWTRNEFKGW